MGTIGTISLIIPQIGQPDTTEDVKVQNAFTTIQTVINGNVDTNNLNASAAVKKTQLAYGSWIQVAFGTGISNTAYVPSSQVFGDTVYLKGGLSNISGGTIGAGTVLATVDTSAHPGGAVFAKAVWQLVSSPTVVVMQIASNGQISLPGSALPTGWSVYLDGIFYTLN